MNKRTIASMLTLALMTGYGAPLATVAMAEYNDEDILMALILAGMLEDGAKKKKSKKKSSSKKSSTQKSSTKKSSTQKISTSNSSSAQPSYTLSDVTPYSGVVRTNGGSLNMRKTASVDSDVVMSLANGTFVTVNGKTSNGWLRVTAGNQVGFVSSRYIAEMIEESTLPAPEASTAPEAAETKAANDALYYVIANPLNNFVNMREGADTSTPVIGVYHYGAVLKVIAIDGDWSKVEDESNGKVGYIKSTQLQRTDLETEEDHG